jgi:hypothetical protein
VQLLQKMLLLAHLLAIKLKPHQHLASECADRLPV